LKSHSNPIKNSNITTLEQKSANEMGLGWKIDLPQNQYIANISPLDTHDAPCYDLHITQCVIF